MGENLQRLRKEEGTVQEDGPGTVVRQTISKWETDGRPGVDNLKALGWSIILDQLTGRARRGRIPKSFMEALQRRPGPWPSFAWQFGWRWQRQVNCMEASLPGPCLCSPGCPAVFLSLRCRSIVWGGILCGEGLSILVSAICTIFAKQLASGMISVGLAAMLGIWVKYLTSRWVA